jgi:hypothetical protein
MLAMAVPSAAWVIVPVIVPSAASAGAAKASAPHTARKMRNFFIVFLLLMIN